MDPDFRRDELSQGNSFLDLLGPILFEEAAQALWKSQSLPPEGRQVSALPFAAFRPGSIDYTPHQETMRRLLRAMEERKVCKIHYQSISENKPKTYFIKPLKLFSHHDTIYLHARIAKTPGKKYQEPNYDPLLAIYRFKEVEITDRVFEFPTDYDFEKIFNRQFGINKDEVFEVVVELTGWAARYVAEAKLIEPNWLVRRVSSKVDRLKEIYKA